MRRRITLLLALLLLLCLAGGAQAAEWKDDAALSVMQEINAERVSRGLGALQMDAELMRAARVRAEEIVEKFSHTRPDGTRWKTVSNAAYAENIARGQKTADKAAAAWMTSEGHRRNILNANYTTTGVACIQSGNVFYWVQIFGK